jgi:hypothetical protein
MAFAQAHIPSHKEQETLWPAIPEKGWQRFRILPPQQSFLHSFDDLVFDHYAPHCQRYRRFSQFKASFVDGLWEFALLPHRPFIQSAQYNSFSGGILRHFEPLACDISPYLDEVLALLRTNTQHAYHLDVHQYRVNATAETNGISVPEGPHRDGQQCVVILVFRRHNINGAELSLHDPVTKEAFYKTIVGENEGVVLDDEKMLHNASPITATGANKGYRDYVILNINEWSERRYGEDFERQAIGPAAQ